MVYTRPPQYVLKKYVATMLTPVDYDRLCAVLKKNGLRKSAYIRSVLVDAIAEDEVKLKDD